MYCDYIPMSFICWKYVPQKILMLLSVMPGSPSVIHTMWWNLFVVNMIKSQHFKTFMSSWENFMSDGSRHNEIDLLLQSFGLLVYPLIHYYINKRCDTGKLEKYMESPHYRLLNTVGKHRKNTKQTYLIKSAGSWEENLAAHKRNLWCILKHK